LGSYLSPWSYSPSSQVYLNRNGSHGVYDVEWSLALRHNFAGFVDHDLVIVNVEAAAVLMEYRADYFDISCLHELLLPLLRDLVIERLRLSFICDANYSHACQYRYMWKMNRIQQFTLK
jgi:hypothetical protein